MTPAHAHLRTRPSTARHLTLRPRT